MQGLEFPRVSKLMLQNNPLANIRKTAESISKMFPFLMELQISLFDEKDIDVVFAAIPSL